MGRECHGEGVPWGGVPRGGGDMRRRCHLLA